MLSFLVLCYTLVTNTHAAPTKPPTEPPTLQLQTIWHEPFLTDTRSNDWVVDVTEPYLFSFQTDSNEACPSQTCWRVCGKSVPGSVSRSASTLGLENIAVRFSVHPQNMRASWGEVCDILYSIDDGICPSQTCWRVCGKSVPGSVSRSASTLGLENIAVRFSVHPQNMRASWGEVCDILYSINDGTTWNTIASTTADTTIYDQTTSLDEETRDQDSVTIKFTAVESGSGGQSCCGLSELYLYGTDIPSVATAIPTVHPTDHPTRTPTDHPTDIPSDHPADTPTSNPTDIPSDHPADTPTSNPTDIPSDHPANTPTSNPTNKHTYPVHDPTHFPSTNPSIKSNHPTNNPVEAPTNNPVAIPTYYPVVAATNNPAVTPTNNPPAVTPTNNPIDTPTDNPIVTPTNNPVDTPTNNPIETPTSNPIVTTVINPSEGTQETDDDDDEQKDAGGSMGILDLNGETSMIVLGSAAGVLVCCLVVLICAYITMKRGKRMGRAFSENRTSPVIVTAQFSTTVDAIAMPMTANDGITHETVASMSPDANAMPMATTSSFPFTQQKSVNEDVQLEYGSDGMSMGSDNDVIHDEEKDVEYVTPGGPIDPVLDETDDEDDSYVPPPPMPPSQRPHDSDDDIVPAPPLPPSSVD
eukprot:1065506_1